MNSFMEVWYNFSWFFSLGGVVLISVILTLLIVWIIKKTILKKRLSTATDTQQDKILGLTGTILSLIIYTIVYLASEMIIQGKFMIDFQGALSAVSIPTGAAVTWVAAKGLYTVLHKWIKRIKDKGLSKGDAEELKKDINEVKSEIQGITILSNGVEAEVPEVPHSIKKKLL